MSSSSRPLTRRSTGFLVGPKQPDVFRLFRLTYRPAQRPSAGSPTTLRTLRRRAPFGFLHSPTTAANRLGYDLEHPPLLRIARFEPPRVRAMLGSIGEELGATSRAVQQLRASLNPLSRFDFGMLRTLRHARNWQAKEGRRP